MIRRLLPLLLLALLAIPAHAETPPIHELVGRLVLDPVGCDHGTASGSWFVMTVGTRAFRNTTPNCGNGTATLLPPGTSGLSVGSFTPDPTPAFDASGGSLARAVIRPVAFDGHRLGLASAAQDVQDAPYGPATFPAPQALVQGSVLVVDLRALHVTFDGHPGTTCRSAQGHGCWLVGTRSARGTWNPATRAFTLDWVAGQGFAGPSAAASFHLSGHFVGTSHEATVPAPQGSSPHLSTGRASAPSAPGASSRHPSPGTSSRAHVSATTPFRTNHRTIAVAASALVLLNLAALSLQARGRRS